MQLEHVGLNHLRGSARCWSTAVDRLPELIQRHADDLAAETELPVALIRLQRAVPSYYLRYYYFDEAGAAELRAGRPRAEEVMEIERGLLEMYADPALEVKPKLLEERGGAFYSEASAMLIESLYADRGDVQVVNMRNEGAIPNLADDAVVEVPCAIDASGAHAAAARAARPRMHGLVQHAKAYERLTVQAAVSGDAVSLRRLFWPTPWLASTMSRGPCWTRCSRPTASICRASSAKACRPDTPGSAHPGTRRPACGSASRDQGDPAKAASTPTSWWRASRSRNAR